MRKLLMLTYGLALAAYSAHAGIVTVNFDSAIQSGTPGSTLNFTGTLTNTDSVNTQFIFGDSMTFALTADDSSFLTGPVSLAHDEISPNFLLFSVALSANQALGQFNGTIDILGGRTDTAQDVIGTGNFTVNVVPEPGTMLLLGAALAVLVRKRRG